VRFRQSRKIILKFISFPAQRVPFFDGGTPSLSKEIDRRYFGLRAAKILRAITGGHGQWGAKETDMKRLFVLGSAALIAALVIADEASAQRGRGGGAGMRVGGAGFGGGGMGFRGGAIGGWRGGGLGIRTAGIGGRAFGFAGRPGLRAGLGVGAGWRPGWAGGWRPGLGAGRWAGWRGGWGGRRWGWGWPIAAGLALGAYGYGYGYGYDYPYGSSCLAWDGYSWVNVCYSSYGYGGYGGYGYGYPYRASYGYW